jgi:hypothetical protein
MNNTGGDSMENLNYILVINRNLFVSANSHLGGNPTRELETWIA